MRVKPLLAPIAVTALLALFVWALAGRVVALVGTGEPIAIALAVGVSLTVAVGVLILFKEWQLAATVQKMSNILAARGELITDSLPRSPGGRIDREYADQQFDQLRNVTHDSPDSWESWFQLGFGYDASGDRKHARQALRNAAKLFRAAS